MALNQNIKHLNSLIRSYKHDITQLKNTSKDILPIDVFRRTMDIFDTHNDYTKHTTKLHLQNKFLWLMDKYYKRVIPQDSGIITEDVGERVTVINVPDITENEKSLLALGPNYSLNPRIDETFMNKVKVDVARCAVQLRNQEGSETSGTDAPRNTLYGSPFQIPFVRTPETASHETEDKLAQLNKFVINTMKNARITNNLTRQQRNGLKTLKRRDNIHLSVSDKCGEFVVTTKQIHKQITLDHLETTSIYKQIAPTRKSNNTYVTITNPTDVQYSRQIQRKTTQLEADANQIWKDICLKHEFDFKVWMKFNSVNSTLPCLYVNVKTHKYDVNYFINKVNPSDIKVRPIISCCGSPTEHIAWIVTRIISQLLTHIPTHLNSFHQHLANLTSIHSQHTNKQHFFSADVNALYTNLNIEGCIRSVMDMINEFKDSIDMMGLSIVELQTMLEFILSNSFFSFDNKLYKQEDGLFMGLRPSPPIAVIRLWTFIRDSVYTDTRFLHVVQHFKLYIDDGCGIVTSRAEAELFLQTIADKDPDGKLSWELEFQADGDTWIPFLNTEVRIASDGNIKTRLYRKPQRRNITIHAQSHHPKSMKYNTIRNSFKDAKEISSGNEEAEHSSAIVEKLYRCNGYRLSELKQETDDTVINDAPQKPGMLCLDYVSEDVSNKIRQFIRKSKLNLRVIFLPGRKLRNLFCSSRPYDHKKCLNTKCDICPRITTKGKNCLVKNIVYKITCNICKDTYIGETSRTAHHRLGEHMRYAKHPKTKSNCEQALAIHYTNNHCDVQPDLAFDILTVQPNTSRRKIYEAMFIYQNNPKMNLREELKTVERFLIVHE